MQRQNIIQIITSMMLGRKYYMVITRRIGLNEDGIMEHIFSDRRSAESYADWLRLYNMTYTPVEIVGFRSRKVYECNWEGNR